MSTQTAESDTLRSLVVEHNPTNHFQLHLSRLISHIVTNIYQSMPTEQLEHILMEYPFIAAYRQQLSDLPFDDWLTEFEMEYAGHLPIRTLRERLGITGRVRDLILVAGLIEEDIRFGALFAALQDPLPYRQPCLGILNWLLSMEADREVPTWQIAEDLAQQGFLSIQRGEGDVRLEWTVRVPMPVWDALRGVRLHQPFANVRLQPALAFPEPEALIFTPVLHEQIRHLPAMIASGQLDTLVLRGMTGVGRRTTLGAIARELGRDLLLYTGEKMSAEEQLLFGPLATLTHALPVIRLEAGAGETLSVEFLPGYNGTQGIIMSRIGGLEGPAMENALTILLPPPTREQRIQFWQASGLPLSPEHAATVANRFLLTGGRIVHVGKLAQNRMHLDGREEATAEDVRMAMQAVNRQVLETLAAALPAVPDWSNLVVDERVRDELEVLEARCRRREQLLEHVGSAFRHNLNRGVRALFSGQSGTGKTLAARALAGVLQMDIYRVDLASVVNKYIGETEKNLNRIFTYAEELDIILLLDEGDSLMTQRTDVRGANDRYANLETNFLLQRLESYEGIILITTNAAQRIDQAFIRRMDVVIDFALPEAEQRRQLWQLHLPEDHQIDTIFLERVIQRCKLTGGQIRNTALHASLLALRQGHPITAEALATALQREFHKASHPYPLANSPIPK